jgi:hypothetical protein
LILVQSQTDVRQGAFSGFVIPEFGIHQNTIMIEEYVLFHSLDPFQWPPGHDDISLAGSGQIMPGANTAVTAPVPWRHASKDWRIISRLAAVSAVEVSVIGLHP